MKTSIKLFTSTYQFCHKDVPVRSATFCNLESPSSFLSILAPLHQSETKYLGSFPRSSPHRPRPSPPPCPPCPPCPLPPLRQKSREECADLNAECIGWDDGGMMCNRKEEQPLNRRQHYNNPDSIRQN